MQSRLLPRFALLSIIAFATAPSPALAQNASTPVPEQVRYVTAFVERLNLAGLKVEKVALSKYNGGYFGPTQAAWIKTEKGVLEVVVFDKPAELDAIQLLEEDPGVADYHHYRITLIDKKVGMEGRLPVFFIKYEGMLIVTYDAGLNKTLKDILH